MPGCVVLSDARQPCLDDRGHPPEPRAERRIFAPQRSGGPASASCADLTAGTPKLVAFESVYSMDGDIAPIAELCDVADAYGAMTYLDEVHGGRPLWPARRRRRRARGRRPPADRHRGHAGQGLRRDGRLYRGLGRDSATSCAASPPASSSPRPSRPRLLPARLASIRHLKASPAERDAPAGSRRHAYAAGSTRPASPTSTNPSHIVPVMVGDPVLCKQISDVLLEHFGIYVQPINYPTVPRGTERLRITPVPASHGCRHRPPGRSAGVLWAEIGLKRAA